MTAPMSYFKVPVSVKSILLPLLEIFEVFLLNLFATSYIYLGAQTIRPTKRTSYVLNSRYLHTTKDNLPEPRLRVSKFV